MKWIPAKAFTARPRSLIVCFVELLPLPQRCLDVWRFSMQILLHLWCDDWRGHRIEEKMGSEYELSGFEQGVLETLKRCQQRNENTLLWGMEVTKCVRSWGIALPCAELGQVLVSHLCFDNNHSSLWKFMEQALSSGLIYPLQVLSLLTSRYSNPFL